MVPQKNPRFCEKTLVFTVFLSPKPESARTHTFQTHCLHLSRASHLAANAATKHYDCVRASLRGSALETEQTEKQTEKTEKPRIQKDMGPPQACPPESLIFQFFQFFVSFLLVFTFIIPLVLSSNQAL